MPLSHSSLLRQLRAKGLGGVARAACDRVFPPRLVLRTAVLAAVRDGRGLEIGGPSRVFSARGPAPVYPHAACIDNVNFAPDTAWESALRDGGEFRFDRHRPPGRQWLREARALTGLAAEAYDFILSSHCLEHLADPLGALAEWRRVVRPGGHGLFVLPDPARSFDHRRPVTTLDHLRDDRARSTSESDSTHFPEVLALHDVALDPGVADAAELAHRVADNTRQRCVHHHVFNAVLLGAALTEAGWEVVGLERARPVHLFAFARRPAA